MPSMFGDPWTTVANARVLQRGCREQQMREIAWIYSPTSGLTAAHGSTLKSGPIRHLHAFGCKQRGCVLGFPNTLGSGWWSLQFLEKLRAHLWSSGMHLGQTICPRRPTRCRRQPHGVPKTQPSFFTVRQMRHLSNHTSGHWHCQNLSETRPQIGVMVLGEL